MPARRSATNGANVLVGCHLVATKPTSPCFAATLSCVKAAAGGNSLRLDDGLSKFIGGLYEAVHEPDGWRKAIAELLRVTDSHMFVVSSVDLRRQEFADMQFHGPQDSSVETGIREFTEEMASLDPTMRWAHQNPSAGYFESVRMTATESYYDDPFIKWSKSRFGSLYWNAFYTEPVDDFSFAVSFHPDPDEGPSSQKQLRLQALLFENLERAVRLAARPPNFAEGDSALIAIDAAGRPLSLSQRAENILAEADGLLLRDGIVTSACSKTALSLERAIRVATAPPSDELLGRSLMVRRSRGKSDLIVIVNRFPPMLDHLPWPAPVALLRLIELEMRPDHLGEHAPLFDLTCRETEVAAALLEGHSVDSLAVKLGVSRNTARNHLQALFRKTDTNRQSDLMRILDRVARQ